GNTLTFPVSGTGSAGMEACIVNLVEPGDAVVVGVNGVFGTRMADVIERAGGVAVRVEAPWGRIVRPEQVEAALRNCRRPKLVAQYWGEERVYHRTAPISMNYAVREALRLVAEEGLEARFARHRKNHEALAAGLGALGLALAAEEGHRLPMLNAVTVPEGIDEARVRTRLLAEHGIEIG